MPIVIPDSIPLCGDNDSSLVHENPEEWLFMPSMLALLDREVLLLQQQRQMLWWKRLRKCLPHSLRNGLKLPKTLVPTKNHHMEMISNYL